MRIMVIAAMLAAAPAAAQTRVATEGWDPRCFYASLSFSPGADVAFGSERYRCALENGIGVWIASPNAGLQPHCLFSGDPYGAGAQHALSGTGGQTITCQPDGSWK